MSAEQHKTSSYGIAVEFCSYLPQLYKKEQRASDSHDPTTQQRLEKIFLTTVDCYIDLRNNGYSAEAERIRNEMNQITKR